MDLNAASSSIRIPQLQQNYEVSSWRQQPSGAVTSAKGKEKIADYIALFLFPASRTTSLSIVSGKS